MSDRPGLFEELRRRNVFRAAAMYAVVAWLLIQIADATVEPLGIPEAAHRILIIVVALGFPVALVLGWIFDWTSEGLVRTPDDPEAEVVRLRLGRRMDYAIIGVLVLSIGFMLGQVLLGPEGPEDARWDRSRGKAPTSVVVLPFDDMSAEGDQEYFAHGMSEELTGALTRVPGLRVVGRTTAEVVKERRLAIDEIGAQLGVGAVVEGSVRRAGDRLRITAQLIPVDSGFHLWAETYDRPLGDVFAIQDEIASAISAALEVRLGGRPEGPSDLRAYDLTLLGFRYFHRNNAPDMEKAVQSFEAALAIEPDYALAHAGLANALAGVFDTAAGGRQILAVAEAEARRSLALDPDLPEARDILGVVLWWKGRYAEGLREVDRSLELNPGFALAYEDRANILAELGRIDEAREAADRASDLDPLSALIVHGSGRHAYYGGDYDDAIERMQRGRALGHTNWVHLAVALAAAGKAEQALHLMVPADASEETRQQLQATFEESGLPGAARAALDARAAATGRACTGNPMYGALQLALSGDSDRMFDCLDEAREESRLLYLKVDPVFAPYRDDPRFQAILSGMGLAD